MLLLFYLVDGTVHAFFARIAYRSLIAATEPEVARELEGLNLSRLLNLVHLILLQVAQLLLRSFTNVHHAILEHVFKVLDLICCILYGAVIPSRILLCLLKQSHIILMYLREVI